MRPMTMTIDHEPWKKPTLFHHECAKNVSRQTIGNSKLARTQAGLDIPRDDHQKEK